MMRCMVFVGDRCFSRPDLGISMIQTLRCRDNGFMPSTGIDFQYAVYQNRS